MHTFTDPDLIELDRIWPLGQKLVVPKNGVIVVAGAYEGRYIRYLKDMFPTAWLYGYEPQKDAFNVAKERLVHDHSSVILVNRGLATNTRLAKVGNYGTDGCSEFSIKGERSCVQMVDAAEALNAGLGSFIELLVLNCEGGEWALIPYLLNEMMHHRIKSMAIQFHPEYVSVERSDRVLNYLGEYYINTFNCPGWSYWQRKDT